MGGKTRVNAHKLFKENSQRRDMEFHALTVEETLKETSTTPTGLATQEVQHRLMEYGENKLKKKKRAGPLVIFLRQFKDIVVYILLVAFILSLLLKENLDAYIIFAILIFNAILGFFQEYKAERAIEMLKKLTSLKVKVLRDGKPALLPSEQLVPGDIVLLEQGDKINADMRVMEASLLQTDEASLTGESAPCNKSVQSIAKTVELAERSDMLYAGTTIVRGTGKAIVVTTGMNTEIGKIAELVQEETQGRTPLQKKLAELGKTLGYVTVGISLVVFLVGIARKLPALESLLTAISLAVAVIPEGLPAVVTICLALSVQKMVKKNALIRRLKSIETLGSVTVICSDKTGTLTKNEMTVKQIFTNKKDITVAGEGYNADGFFFQDGKKINSADIALLLDIAASCNNASEEMGDPTERALLFAALKANIKKRERTNEIPFDSDKKYMATTHIINKKEVVYYKGAPEVILERCQYIDISGQQRRLLPKDREKILAKNHEMADAALRVLGMAYERNGNTYFVGLMGMIDPPKEGVKEAIALCRQAGIRSIMITGDHPRTAVAIAHQIGLESNAITGAELDGLQEEKLTEVVNTYSIFARTTSVHKVKILEALQKQGPIVAMTGDGINDAPALKKADVGVAMALKGTDVSRETADMILADDNFASIVSAIHYGRIVYDNIKKFVNYLLSANTAEVGVILGGLLLGLPLPLLPLQILWINLMTDSWPALALGVDTPDSDVMKRKPRRPEESLFEGIRGQIILTGIVGTIVVLSVFWLSLRAYNETTARTIAMTTMILFEILRAFSCKSTRPFSHVFSNKWLNLAALLSICLQAIILYTPLNIAFKIVPLTGKEWAYSIFFALCGYMALELYKWVAAKKEERVVTT